MLESVVRLQVEAIINEGELEAFLEIAREMCAGSAKEPGTIGYEWFLSEDNKRCRLLETYLNADAVLAHFTGPVVTQLVPRLAALCQVDRFEFYGDPGPQVMAMAGAFGAKKFNYAAGIGR